MFKIRVLALLFAISLSPQAVLADEIDLGGWKTHAAMAEQGAVCGAFADLMAMQTLVDEKVGRLWSERGPIRGRSSGARPNLKAGPMLTTTASTIF
jgi:hypothetical protein